MKSKWGVLLAVVAVAVILQAVLPHLGQIIVIGGFVFAATIIIPIYFRFLKAMIKVYAVILSFMVALYFIQLLILALKH